MKKLLSQICGFILCVALLIGMLPTQSFAETAQTENLSRSSPTETAQEDSNIAVESGTRVVGEISEKRTEGGQGDGSAVPLLDKKNCVLYDRTG